MSTARCSQIFRIIVTLFVIAANGHPLVSFPVKFIPGQTYKYIYSTEVALNEPSSTQATSAKKDVGFRFSAEVEVTPVWTNNVNLIRLLIVGPRLHSVAAQSDVFRDLKTLPRLPIYFQWEAGRVGTIFGDDEDTVQATNIKKGIISLFQLRMEDGTHSEVDTSGECKVTYVKINGDKVRKTKADCISMDTLGRFSQVNELLGMNLTSSFQAEYTVSDDAIKSVASTEKWLVQMNLDESVSSVITVKQSLALKETGTVNFVPADSSETLLKTLEAERGHKFLRSDLATVFEPRQCTAGCSSAVDLVGKRQSNFYTNRIGKTVAALMFRDLVKAVREMPKDAILDLLKDKNNEGIILPLIDVVSAAQTPLAQSALMEFLNFEDEYKISEPERYLLATAMSTHPPEQVLQDLLGLFEKSIPSEKLRESIAAALGAVTNTFYRMKNDASHKAVVDVQTAFLKKLSDCTDGASCTRSTCQKIIIRSLANAGLPDTVDVLLTHAETSKDSGVSEEALKALRRIDRKLITSKVRDRLKDIFHQKRRGFDTAVRSQALSIILETGPTLEEVREIIMETNDPWNTDYSLYIQSKVFDLMQHNCTVKAMVKEILSNPELSNYNFLAPKGKSLAFTSNLAEKPKTTYSMYVENTRTGIMKRSGMDVDIFSPIQKLPLYSVGIFAAGLEGLIADEVDVEDAETEVTAGMALDMIGVSLRPITFFTGKGGLMSAIWSAPSQLVSALQTTFLLQDHSERLHLQNGLIAELDVQGVLSIDLSGKLSVSLWNKNSQSLIRNRGAFFVFSSLTVASSSFRTGIDVSAQVESSLDFRTDVDFYDGVKMCLQMSRPDFYVKRNVTKYESARGFKRTFTSKTNRTTHINAVSYPLPGPNSETCRLINPE